MKIFPGGNLIFSEIMEESAEDPDYGVSHPDGKIRPA
jgi:hypothetical protein